MPAARKDSRRMRDDLRGVNQLAVDGVTGTTDLVEAMHAAITHLPAIIGRRAPDRTSGLPGWIYRIIRGTTRAVGGGIGASLATLAPWLGSPSRVAERDGVVAAINGVLGDHLEATANPLATTMCFWRGERALTLTQKGLATAIPDAGDTLVVLLHGLCMNDRQWLYQGHDHGAALARDLDVNPVYLRYNSGRHISHNGADFAVLLQRLVSAWPVEVKRIVIVAHSMGGLVARAACARAAQQQLAWVEWLSDIVFLGVPHHGAPLERAGGWVDRIIGLTPYSAPFVRLGRLRSAGIRDLRHGYLRDQDWVHGENDQHVDARTPMPLPAGVRCHAIATSTQTADAVAVNAVPRGDGLVPIDSALGHHPDPRFDLRIPKSQQWIGYDINHLELLGDLAVYRRIHSAVVRPAAVRRTATAPHASTRRRQER